ncbi:S8 family serine peptidase [Dactylosporangium sp. NPDC005572]|uniref:S8 family serine peptidase n=1 Tax=Dactylosporangium sp. NPDC005572 TaxID=3156889 RepID=UPI0033B11377
MAAPTGEGYVKYYIVTSSYRGAPENLEEISVRFLHSADRADEVFNLNAGRRQPDGGQLAEPDVLRPGWLIVLPWDATGEGVRYGLLSMADPPVAAGTPSPAGAGGATGGPAGNSGRCAATTTKDVESGWAHLRMAPEAVWDHADGRGVMVAIIDSGVDGDTPPLAGRVSAGVDITEGSSRGNTDCLGSGTAMAGIVAARDTGDGVAGMAPSATVFPVRVVADEPHARPATAATGIEVAVSAGAKVIALGSYVDLRAPEVAAAVKAAAFRDVVVVAGAPTGSSSDGSAGPRPAETALLKVGGVGPDGQPAGSYVPGTVDLVAPGIDVATIAAGTNRIRASSGTQYAVAFVAGAAALVRSAHPELNAAQVAHRMRLTAERAGITVPDVRTGWGVVVPAAAVTTVLPEELRELERSAPSRSSGTLRQVLAVVLPTMLLAAVAAYVVWLIRRANERSATRSRTAIGEGQHRRRARYLRRGMGRRRPPTSARHAVTQEPQP